MNKNSHHVQQLDHVEVFVPDRIEAAHWFQQVLGLSIVEEYRYWAQDPNGPLMISPDGGNTKIALFESKELSTKRGGYDQIAFRIDGPGFVAFSEHISSLELINRSGKKLSSDNISDHDGAYSFHFLDPGGHRIEVTTYDCEYVQSHR